MIQKAGRPRTFEGDTSPTLFTLPVEEKELLYKIKKKLSMMRGVETPSLASILRQGVHLLFEKMYNEGILDDHDLESIRRDEQNRGGSV